MKRRFVVRLFVDHHDSSFSSGLSRSKFKPPTRLSSSSTRTSSVLRIRYGILGQEWCTEVEKRTNGRVKVTYFPGNTLTPPTQTYDSVVKGIADVGQTLAAYSAGRFLLTEVLAQPIGYTSGYQATKTCNEYYKKFKPKEFDDTKIMYIHGHGPGMFQTVKAISSVDDHQGPQDQGQHGKRRDSDGNGRRAGDPSHNRNLRRASKRIDRRSFAARSRLSRDGNLPTLSRQSS